MTLSESGPLGTRKLSLAGSLLLETGMTKPLTRRSYSHQFKEPARNDPNRSRTKAAGTPQCPECSSVSIRGRWVPQKSAKATLVTGKLMCPACRQLQQKFALGVVECHGENWKALEEEVSNTVRNTEKIARNRNDQERVLWIKKLKNVMKIYVTLPELARSIGRQLEKSIHGVVEYERSSEEPYLRVRWWSDLPHIAHQPGAPLQIKKRSKAPLQNAHRSKLFRKRGAA
jgi:hypothetical protein